MKVIVALGRIAFDAAWRLLGDRGIVVRPKPQFGHGLVHFPPGGPAVVGSYHPSRQNTNTGLLTASMLESVFVRARELATGSDLSARVLSQKEDNVQTDLTRYARFGR